MKRFYVFIYICIAPILLHGQGIDTVFADLNELQQYRAAHNLDTVVTIKHIIVTGNKVTRWPIILRELSITENGQLNLDSLQAVVTENKLRIANMALFNDIDIGIGVINDKEINWYISVKERWYIIPEVSVGLIDRNFNVWWVEQHHDLNRINFTLSGIDNNFRGNLEYLKVTAQGGYTKKLGIIYRRPYLNERQKGGFGFTFMYYQMSQTYYNAINNKLAFVGNYGGPPLLTQYEGTLSYLYRGGYATKHIFQVSYKAFNAADTVLAENRNFFANGSKQLRLLEFYYRVSYNRVDNWGYPLKGFKLVSISTVRKGLEGFNFQATTNIETGIFRNPLPKWYVSGIFRGRIMLPENQPYVFLGGLGNMSDYVRGYEYFIINGSHYGILRFDLKRELINHTFRNIPIRYFTSLPIRVYPKIFCDAGYIKNNTDIPNPLAGTLLYSIGAGIDLVTFYDFKISMEFAYNHLKQNGLYLHTNSE